MTAPVASPCVNVCEMDAATGWCAGCLRSIDEIAGWSRLSEAARLQVCDQLPQRRIEWRRLGRPEVVNTRVLRR
jgi:uncharacterized protein